MPDEIMIEPIKYHEPLRKVLNDVFKDAGDLPIRGGWGYSREEAIVIDKNDPVVAPGLPFDGVGIEYKIAELMAYLELIVFRKADDRYSGIETKVNTQYLKSIEGKQYDVLVVDVTAFREKDFNVLKEEWMDNEGNPDFDVQKHLEKMEKFLCFYTRELWFDITSFYGSY